MNIILGEDRAQELSKKYLVLSLDTFAIEGQSTPVKSFCVLSDVSVSDLSRFQEWKDLHENLIRNYGLKNWNYCEQAIEHLTGRWNRELDSFYADLNQRVKKYRDSSVTEDWSPVIHR